MKYTADEFIKALGMSLTERLMAGFDKLSEITEDDIYYLSDGYIRGLDERYALLGERLEFVLKYATRVRGNDVLSTLFALLRGTVIHKERLEYVAFPPVPSDMDEERAREIEMTAFLAILAFAQKTYDFAVNSGMPPSVARDTVDCYRAYLDISKERLSREGFLASTYYSWNQRYINHSIFKIGILNYEMIEHCSSDAYLLTNGKEYKVLMNNKEISSSGRRYGSAGCSDVAFVATFTETDEYFEGYEVDTENALVLEKKVTLDKKSWRVAVAPGDPILSVHIPKECKLTRENIDAAHTETLGLIGSAFPSFGAKAIYCCSWLLDGQIAKLVGEGSNIVRFQSDFIRYPTVSAGRGVYSFLFGKTGVCEVSELPENTSLQRLVKEKYMAGGYIYEVAGFIPVERYYKG